jgi:hypothetical protein
LSRAEAVDVLEVGAGHDEHVDALGTERFDAHAHLGGVGLPIRHRGAIPVEDERVECLVRTAGAPTGDGHRQEIMGCSPYRSRTAREVFRLWRSTRRARTMELGRRAVR